jgi:hypothetical protein
VSISKAGARTWNGVAQERMTVKVWRIVNSEAKRKGVEVPERRGCWGGTGSGRGGAIVYQGRDTVRRAGRGQGRAEVSVKRGE